MSIIDHVLGKNTWIPPEETPCYSDPDMWTDTSVQKHSPEGKAEAKRACKVYCPFQEQCLAYAMRVEGSQSHFYRYGIWGGTTPHQRYQMYLGADSVANETEIEGETK